MGAVGGMIGGALGSVFLPGAGTIIGEILGSKVGDIVSGAKSGDSNSGNDKKGSGMGLKSIGSAEKVGAAVGLGQAILGKIQQKKADALMPMNVDPRLDALQRYNYRKRRAADTGTLNSSARNMLNQTYKQSLLNASRFGGNVGTVQSSFNQALGQLGNQGEETAMKYGQIASALTENIAQTQMEKQLAVYDRQQARSAQNLTDAKQNIGAALMRSIDPESNSADAKKKKGYTFDINNATDDTGASSTITTT